MRALLPGKLNTKLTPFTWPVNIISVGKRDGLRYLTQDYRILKWKKAKRNKLLLHGPSFTHASLSN